MPLMATFHKPKQNASGTAARWCVFCVTAVMLCTLAVSVAVTPAKASSKKAEPAATKEETSTAPVIPDTVLIPDPVSLTVVLPKSGTLRQLVFHIWLEATNKQAVEEIEKTLPKVINAFLVDLQRLMYRDTQNRFENHAPGKRGFKFDAPPLLPPPPAKTEEERHAEAEAAKQAADNGEEITPDPPFSPFAPVPNRYFAALQFQLQRTAQAILPPDSLRSVQIRKFYDYWPDDAKKR